MNWLAIDTSSSYLTVAVRFNGQIYGEFLPSCGLTHSVMLNSTVEKVLNSAGATLADLDLFSCVVGAGSFTGIRIGVSTIKAFSYATNKPVLGVTAFDVLAYTTDRNNIVTAIDARNDNFYACVYDKKVAGEPKFISGEELRGLGLEIITADKVDLFKGLVLAVENNLSNIGDRESLVPLYCKKSQAEEC